MHLEYDLNDKVPFMKSFLLGIQWAALLLSSIIILGKVVGEIHFENMMDLTLYFQKVTFLGGVTLILQVIAGHRLPLIPGPAAILLIAIVASQAYDLTTIYSSVMLGGFFYTIVAISGLFGLLQRFFTTNVVAVVLLLVAFTLAPNIQDLMAGSNNGIDPLYNMSFSIGLLLLLFLAYRILKGTWRSTLIIWSIIFGSILYYLIFPSLPRSSGNESIPFFSFFFRNMITSLSFQPGVIISFMFCYIALSINDLGSISSVLEMLAVSHGEKRIKRGLILTGLSNIFCGFFGVIGFVNYTLSPGVIMSTRCASRFTLIPASVILFLLAFFPRALGFIGRVPSAVTGAILAFVLTSQVAAGLMLALRDQREKDFQLENGMVIGLSILLGTMVAFLPLEILNRMPLSLRPILGNGFVIGTLSAAILEHLVFIRKMKK